MADNAIQKDQPPAQDAPNRRVYRGKPENQRDRNALHQPFPKKPTSGQNQQRRAVPAELPPPKNKQQNVGGSVSSGNPADATLFAVGVSIRETVPRQTFSPSTPALPDIAAQTYSELITDDSALSKVLLPEYLQYYSTAMLWCRIVTLKEKNSQALTVAEQNLLMAIQSATFTVPEPITLQIRALGNIVTSTKQHLYPTFPSLPAEVIQQQGGYYGALVQPAPNVDNTRHNLYEEIPCLGVAAFGVRQALSNLAPGNYASTVTFNGQQPNGNLLGYRPLGYRRNEAKNLALDQGITEVNFPSYPGNTAFNLDFLMAISNSLANTKTFKNTSIVFSGLTEIGAQSQIVIAHPLIQDQEGPAIRGELRPSSLIKESESIFGSGIFFAPQMMKVIGGDNLSWSMFVNIPQEWLDNANDRRNLPIAYMQETFSAISQRASGFRLNVIKTMVTTKR